MNILYLIGTFLVLNIAYLAFYMKCNYTIALIETFWYINKTYAGFISFLSEMIDLYTLSCKPYGIKNKDNLTEQEIYTINNEPTTRASKLSAKQILMLQKINDTAAMPVKFNESIEAFLEISLKDYFIYTLMKILYIIEYIISFLISLSMFPKFHWLSFIPFAIFFILKMCTKNSDIEKEKRKEINATMIISFIYAFILGLYWPMF